MNRGLRLNYRPGPEATPETELDALMVLYAFLMQRRESRTFVHISRPNHAEGDEEDGGASSGGGPIVEVTQTMTQAKPKNAEGR